tara:strand:- start:6189 stop:7223 length:1035 start_codon:yes stop_codon:yes gene_type:complete
MNKRVLITGGAGFIGHTLIHNILKQTNWEVVTIDRLDYSGNLNRLDDILGDIPKEEKHRLDIIFHDLRAELNSQICAAIGEVDYILHLAASSHVDRSIDHPMEFVMDNVVGTCNILNFARDQQNLSRFIYFSTDEVFGPAPDGISYAERDRYNSTNPYSATKAGAEELCVSYENSYGMPIYITHTMNVFGNRQHPEKYIPSTIRKVRDGKLVTIHSDATKIVAGSRHYIHTSDVSEAILFLLKLSDLGHVFNTDFGNAKCPKFNLTGKEEVDNLELARRIARAVGEELKYEMIDYHSARPGHDLRYAISGDYMKRLGWEPLVSLNERIQQVVEWSLENDRWLKT